MHRCIAAILTVLLVATAIAGTRAEGEPIELDRPQPNRFTLVDGRERAGAIVRWDDEGFDGDAAAAFGRVRWEDVRAADAYRIRRRLIDLRPAEERRARLLELLAHMASRDDAGRLAERARQEARSAGADEAALEAATQRAAALRAARTAREALKASAALERRSPERGPFPASAWPPVVPTDRDALVAEIRRKVTALLARSGREPTATEGDACIVWSDLGVEHGARVALDFDRFVVEAGPKLGIPIDDPDRRLRWAKTAIVVLDGEARFRLFEAAAFNQDVPADLLGIAHYDGPDTIIVLRTTDDPTALRIELARGAARSLLHRLDSPIRLPRWAHEGLVDWLALDHEPTRSIDERLRGPGLAFIRGGGSLERVLRLTYDDLDGAGEVERAAGYLLMGLLMEAEGDRARRFIAAIKRGDAWQAAMESELRTSEAALLQSARGHYRFND